MYHAEAQEYVDRYLLEFHKAKKLIQQQIKSCTFERYLVLLGEHRKLEQSKKFASDSYNGGY